MIDAILDLHGYIPIPFVKRLVLFPCLLVFTSCFYHSVYELSSDYSFSLILDGRLCTGTNEGLGLQTDRRIGVILEPALHCITFPTWDVSLRDG